MACAAGERDGPLRAGPKERVLGRRRERERGEGFGLWVFWASSRIWAPFLFLIQTSLNSNAKFEFKPHSIKSMHQHECTTKFKPMIKF